jgi:phage shock protein A
MADVGLAIQRAKEKTEDMQARASAMEELVASGAIQDLTALEGTSAIDRELAQLSTQGQVDEELARLKAELGAGAPPKELEEGEAAPKSADS